MVQERDREVKAGLVQILHCLASWCLGPVAGLRGWRDAGLLHGIRIRHLNKPLRRGVNAINSA